MSLSIEEDSPDYCRCLLHVLYLAITLTILPQRDLSYKCRASSSSGSFKVTSDIVCSQKSQRKHLGRIACERLCAQVQLVGLYHLISQ